LPNYDFKPPELGQLRELAVIGSDQESAAAPAGQAGSLSQQGAVGGVLVSADRQETDVALAEHLLRRLGNSRCRARRDGRDARPGLADQRIELAVERDRPGVGADHIL
jgi:hypothetical protein